MTATAGSDVVQSGRPIFDDFISEFCLAMKRTSDFEWLTSTNKTAAFGGEANPQVYVENTCYIQKKLTV
ncbi:hypothetical protein TNCV_4791011 [Trichonephila clavipes]|nr:hypothetical protein TNCV_4791011 [Trichonephila clavipes]